MFTHVRGNEIHQIMAAALKKIGHTSIELTEADLEAVDDHNLIVKRDGDRWSIAVMTPAECLRMLVANDPNIN